jgi:CRISPR-associated protein Cas2
MEILVAYDVSTDTAAGRRRLRRVAKVCEAYGQRVQNSVFECTLNATELTLFVHRLRAEIDEDEDSLRLYKLREPREDNLQAYGRRPLHDLHDALIL